jgi:hypothetical protein
LTWDRRAHILDGDKTGGGHRRGTGCQGKTEFCAEWDDDKIVHAVLNVAREPDHEPVRHLGGLRLMEEGGEFGELVIELTATLAKTGVSVSATEQQELRALMEATHMPATPVDQLEVSG